MGSGKEQSTAFQSMLEVQHRRVQSDFFATSMMLKCNVLVKHTRAYQVVRSEKHYVENRKWNVGKRNQPQFLGDIVDNSGMSTPQHYRTLYGGFLRIVEKTPGTLCSLHKPAYALTGIRASKLPGRFVKQIVSLRT